MERNKAGKGTYQLESADKRQVKNEEKPMK